MGSIWNSGSSSNVIQVIDRIQFIEVGGLMAISNRILTSVFWNEVLCSLIKWVTSYHIHKFYPHSSDRDNIGGSLRILSTTVFNVLILILTNVKTKTKMLSTFFSSLSVIVPEQLKTKFSDNNLHGWWWVYYWSLN